MHDIITLIQIGNRRGEKRSEVASVKPALDIYINTAPACCILAGVGAVAATEGVINNRARTIYYSSRKIVVTVSVAGRPLLLKCLCAQWHSVTSPVLYSE